VVRRKLQEGYLATSIADKDAAVGQHLETGKPPNTQIGKVFAVHRPDHVLGRIYWNR
jgi:hypothetical protein